jgi:hypothetical protein
MSCVRLVWQRICALFGALTSELKIRRRDICMRWLAVRRGLGWGGLATERRVLRLLHEQRAVSVDELSRFMGSPELSRFSGYVFPASSMAELSSKRGL